MKNKKTTGSLNHCLMTVIFVFLTSLSIKAQLVGTDAYIKATSVEIGIDGGGGFEGCDVTVSPPPAGMHFRSGTNYFGFVANPQLNAWVGSNFDGDFFTPGSPENGWGFEIGTSGIPAGNNCAGPKEINGAITNWSHILSCYSADWEGDYLVGTNLHFKVNYFLQETDLYYTTTVSITNNTAATIADMYYYRNLDPDNNQPVSGDYTTQNTIVSQPGTGCNLAHVSATQTNPWNSYLGLAAIGPNWRANWGGFTNRDASDLWNGAGFTQTVGATIFIDEAIALAYRIQNLAPGATETFKFVVILDNAAATNAINNLLYFSYPGAAGAPSGICSSASDTVRTCGSPVSISVNGSNVTDYTWTWSPGTGLSSTSGGTVTANPATTITYTASGTPLSSCVSPVTMTVVVEVTPSGGANPVITAVPPLCISSPAITLTADSTGGTWSGTGITNTSTGSFDPAVAGIGSFLITYMTPGSCNTVDTVMITIDSTYDATISDPASVCISGSPVNFTSITGGGSWTGTGITNAATGTFDPALAGLGTHVITYAITGTCASTDSTTVEVTNLFDPTITPPASVCQGTSSFNLSAVQPGGVWTGSGITDSINGTFTPSIVGTQQVIYTIPGSCGNADSVNVTVLPTPEVTITPVFPMCLSNPPITLTADSTGGTWSGPGITSASGGTFNPAVSGLGTHIITYSTTSTCSTLDTVIIQVNTFSDATITQPPSICLTGSTVTFSAVTAGGTWSGTGITSSAGGVFDPTVAGLGFHEITYSIAGSCANQDTMMVEVTNLFVVTITQPNNICFGSSPISLTSAHPGGIWSGLSITDSINGVFTPDTVGTQTVTYTISGACGNTDTVNVTVVPSQDATITPVSAVCEDSAPFNLTGVSPGGVWSGTGITDAAAGTFDPIVSGPGTFVITYGVSGVCGDTATQNIIVRNLPSPVFSSDINSGCVPVCITFNEVSPLCNGVHYDFGDGDTTNVSAPTHCYDSAGVYTVSVTCTDIYGCVGTTVDSNMITVNPIPVASFTITPSALIQLGSGVGFVNTSTPGTTTYWTFGDSTGFNNSTIAWSPIHYYAYPGNYCATLISTSAAGCKDTVTNCLEVYDPVLIVPNVFTPNGDNNNDVWRVVSSEGLKSFTCAIYNRWGNKVAEWDGLEEGWNGDGSPDGTYYYLIRATTLGDEDIEKQGFIQLLSN
jgi:gliding motility-associated-like protein